LADFTPGFVPRADASVEACWFVFQRHKLLVSEASGPPVVPVAPTLEALGLYSRSPNYFGAVGDQPCFTAEVSEDVQPPAGWVFENLRRLLVRTDADFFALASRAFQIKEWDRCHQFCGACGATTVLKPGERARVCPRCGELFYPRLAPVIMVLIQRGRQLLLARSPRFPPGIYSALAGFVEPGETLEQAVVREVKEEVGLEIANLRYFGSQSWPFPHSLMIAFLADHSGGEICLADPEIEDAAWYSLDRLPGLPPSMSIARRLIDAVAPGAER
jgi:NAD+ diphosphatase